MERIFAAVGMARSSDVRPFVYFYEDMFGFLCLGDPQEEHYEIFASLAQHGTRIEYLYQNIWGRVWPDYMQYYLYDRISPDHERIIQTRLEKKLVE
jgi:hypothetical protein